MLHLCSNRYTNKLTNKRSLLYTGWIYCAPYWMIFFYDYIVLLTVFFNNKESFSEILLAQKNVASRNIIFYSIFNISFY